MKTSNLNSTCDYEPARSLFCWCQLKWLENFTGRPQRSFIGKLCVANVESLKIRSG